MASLPPHHTELTVGQVAARTGVAVTALHFYETKGLIHSRRTSGGQRRYPRDVIRRVSFIRVAQRVGIPLRLVAEALAGLPDGRTPTREDWALLSVTWQAELDQRIAQLQHLRDDLTDCIGCGCLSIDRCLLRNADDHLGETGQGPRRLLGPRAVPDDCSGTSPTPSEADPTRSRRVP
ncbi:redox-sensitive transcriptional activator SoxR [Micromonospora sp. KLBMP9576]|uniref:redox-sensitive transcriptional activator SoxR n=1 Tax=Micromonospora sp. KLBMP9576 TaxID=3424769 RepID=UPI003D936E8B